MVLYNLTIAVEPRESRKWLEYMQQEHIPQIMATGCFTSYRICEIPAQGDAETTYAVQYLAPSQAHYDHYEAQCASALREDYTKRFGTKTGIFRTLLHVLDEGTAPILDL